jgi:hypothetical protein
MWNATPTNRPGKYGRCLSITLAAVSGVLAIAACGSSSSAGNSASSSGTAQGIKYADCMRGHGVPNFPDPGSGGGVRIAPGSGINPQSPAFQSAQSACSKLLPGGGSGLHGPPSAQARTLMLATSECMRTHGVTGFPDPTTTPPLSINGYSQVIGRGGVFIAVPDTINPGSPTYAQAAAACLFGPSGRAKNAPAP